jgi:hypothetical protein
MTKGRPKEDPRQFPCNYRRKRKKEIKRGVLLAEGYILFCLKALRELYSRPNFRSTTPSEQWQNCTSLKVFSPFLKFLTGYPFF